PTICRPATSHLPETLTSPSNWPANARPVANNPMPPVLDAKTPKLLSLKPAMATLSPNWPSARKTAIAPSGVTTCATGLLGSSVVGGFLPAWGIGLSGFSIGPLTIDVILLFQRAVHPTRTEIAQWLKMGSRFTPAW